MPPFYKQRTKGGGRGRIIYHTHFSYRRRKRTHRNYSVVHASIRVRPGKYVHTEMPSLIVQRISDLL